MKRIAAVVVATIAAVVFLLAVPMAAGQTCAERVQSVLRSGRSLPRCSSVDPTGRNAMHAAVNDSNLFTPAPGEIFLCSRGRDGRVTVCEADGPLDGQTDANGCLLSPVIEKKCGNVSEFALNGNSCYRPRRQPQSVSQYQGVSLDCRAQSTDRMLCYSDTAASCKCEPIPQAISATATAKAEVPSMGQAVLRTQTGQSACKELKSRTINPDGSITEVCKNGSKWKQVAIWGGVIGGSALAAYFIHDAVSGGDGKHIHNHDGPYCQGGGCTPIGPTPPPGTPPDGPSIP